MSVETAKAELTHPLQHRGEAASSMNPLQIVTQLRPKRRRFVGSAWTVSRSLHARNPSRSLVPYGAVKCVCLLSVLPSDALARVS